MAFNSSKGVEIRVRANASQAKKELSSLEKSVLNLEKTTSKVTSGFQKLALGITAAFAAGGATKAINNASDSIINLENQLALVVGRGKELNTTMTQIRNVAGRTRASVNQTATTFNRFGLALRDSGKTVDELLIATEAVQQAAAISGASAQSAEAAIIQLGQGLASGQLRGQELNSVLEQIPELARTIAKGIGIPFGELRQAAMDGLVTADSVFDAIVAGSVELKKKFATIEPTVQALSIVLKDELVRAINEVDSNLLGFADAYKGQLVAATSAIAAFSDNLYKYADNFKIALLDIKLNIIRFTREVHGIFSSVFADNPLVKAISSEYDAAKDSLSGALETVKVKFEVAKIKLGDIFPDLEGVLGLIGTFARAVDGWFEWLYDRIVGNSWWGEIFWEGSNQLGGAKFTAAISNVLGKIELFVWDVEIFFSDLYQNVTKLWEKLWKGLTKSTVGTVDKDGFINTEEVTTGFGKVIDKIKEVGLSIENLYKKATTKQVTLIDANGFVDVKTELNLIGVAVERLQGAFSTLKQSIKEAFALYDTENSFDEFGGAIEIKVPTTLGKFVETLNSGVFEKVSGIITTFTRTGRLFEITSSDKDNAKEVGDFAAKGFVDKVVEQKELIATALAGAFFLALSNPGKAIKIGALVASVTFAPEILSNSGTQATIRTFGKGLGQAIASVLGGDGDFGGAVIDALAKSLQSFGESFLEGAFANMEGGFDNNAIDGIVGGVLAVMGVALVSSKARKGLSLLGVGVLNDVFSANTVKSWKTSRSDKKGGLLGGIGGFLFGKEVGSDLSSAIGLDPQSFEAAGLSMTTALATGIAAYKWPTPFLFALLGYKAGKSAGGSLADVIGFDKNSWEAMGLEMTTAIGAGLAAGVLGKKLVTLVGEAFVYAQGSATTLAAIRNFGAWMLAGIPGGFVLGGATLALAISGAIAAAFFTASNKFNAEGDALRIVSGLADSVSQANGLKYLKAAFSSSFGGNAMRGVLKEVFEENGLTGDEAVEALLSNTKFNQIAEEFNKGVRNALASSPKESTVLELANEVELAFPGFKFDRGALEQSLRDQINGGDAFEIQWQLGDPRVGQDGAIKNAKDSVDSLQKSVDDLEPAKLINTESLLTGISGLFDKLRGQDIITDEQQEQLATGETRFTKLVEGASEYLDTLKDIGRQVISVPAGGTAPAQTRGTPFSTGGKVLGAGGPTDDKIPAMLSNGEYVVKASAVDKFGVGFMNAINQGVVPEKRATGGLIGGGDMASLVGFQTEVYDLEDSLYSALAGRGVQMKSVEGIPGNGFMSPSMTDATMTISAPAVKGTPENVKDDAEALSILVHEIGHGFDVLGRMSSRNISNDTAAYNKLTTDFLLEYSNKSKLPFETFANNFAVPITKKYGFDESASNRGLVGQLSYVREYIQRIGSDKENFTDFFANGNFPSDTAIGTIDLLGLTPGNSGMADFLRVLIPDEMQKYLAASIKYAPEAAKKVYKFLEDMRLGPDYSEMRSYLASGELPAGQQVASSISEQTDITGGTGPTSRRGKRGGAVSLVSYFDGLKEAFLKDSSEGSVDAESLFKSKLNNDVIAGYATGGYISGAGGPTEDKIPAMLSNGEYVIKASSVDKLGLGVLNKLNQGIIPQKFNDGGLATLKAEIQDKKAKISSNNATIDNLRTQSERAGDTGFNNAEISTLFTQNEILYRNVAALESELAAMTGTDGASTNGASTNEPKNPKKKKKGEKDPLVKAGEDYALAFKQDFAQGLSDVLHGKISGEDFFKGLLDSFTSKVIDSFVTGVTEGLFGEKGLFGDLFTSVADWGKGLATGVTEKVQSSVTGDGGGSLFKDLFSNIGDFFGSIFKFVGGLFGGGVPLNSGGVVPNGTQFQMLSNGGIVKPQVGKDSVPTMLTPGEYVVNSKQTADMMKGMAKSQQQQQVYNINVSGDVSRQTRKEIVKMIPQITTGVNATNIEKNYKR